MKWVLRAAAAALALAVLAIGVLFWALPRLAKSDAARVRIEALARAALGRELHYGDIDFALLPPSLLVEQPTVAGEAAGDPPFARADRVALRVELVPLLHGQLEIASLTIDKLALHLVRTADGIAWPRPSDGGSRGGAPAEPEAGGGAGKEEGLGFGIREIALNDGALALEDRSASPPETWSVADIDVAAHGVGSNAPIAIDGSLGAVKGGALEVEGPLSLEAELASGAVGPFRIDAGEARVRYGADFTKPAGTPAALRGRLVTDASGALGVDDLELELRNLVARGQLRTAPRTELRVRADSFALDGWEELVPLLGLAKPRGRIAIPDLALVTDPLGVRGKIALDNVVATPPGRAPIALRGEVELLGTELRTRDLVVSAAEQAFRVKGTVQQLFSAPRYELAVETTGADSNALLSGYTDQRDRLFGPLDLKGTLHGEVSGQRSFLDAMSGDLSFGIEKGRIAGASLLEAALGSVGATLADTVRKQGGKEWQRFYSEEFEFLRGALRVADGVLVTDPITLGYRDYSAQLAGPIRLADLSLDMNGTITFAESLDGALARAFGANDDYAPQKRTLTLASVRGTLGQPKVQLAGSSIANLAATYASATQREELKRRVEKKLGEGSGEIVDQGLDVLQGLLGGGKKR